MAEEPRYVGIDYGVRRVAWAQLSSTGELLEVGEVVMAADEGREEPEEIFDLVLAFHLRFGCTLLGTDVVAIERPITGSSRNAFTAAQMAMRCGALCYRACIHTKHVFLVPPSTWKKYSAVGNGKASKAQVREVIANQYGLTCVSQDICDAIAMAQWAKYYWEAI